MKKLIRRHLLGNMLLTAAIAELPSVMTAAGFSVEPNGNIKLDRINDLDVLLLRNNLFSIGEAAVTAPTTVSDITGLWNIVHHPVKAVKSVRKAIEDISWFIRHPRSIKVYHGTHSKDFTNLRDARVGSPNNIGIHISPNKKVADSYVRGGDDHVLSAWMPRHDMETIDIWDNDYRLFSNDYKLSHTVGLNGGRIGVLYYYTIPNDKLRLKLLKKYGGNPRIVNKPDIYGQTQGYLYLDNDVTIPLQKETWPNMPLNVRNKMDDIISEGRSIELKPGEDYRLRALRLNTEAANLASQNGKKVIKYQNVNAQEGGGGTSYMVTDPKVFYNPQKYDWNRIMNLTKYPIIMNYENDK